jgi:hypothetical protein
MESAPGQRKFPEMSCIVRDRIASSTVRSVFRSASRRATVVERWRLTYSVDRIRELQQELSDIKELNERYRAAPKHVSSRANENRRSRLVEIKEELGAMMKAVRELAKKPSGSIR